MNPYISWGLLTLCAGAVYIYVNGLPGYLVDALSGARDASTERLTSTAKKTKRKARATQKPKPTSTLQNAEKDDTVLATGKLQPTEQEARRTQSSKIDFKDTKVRAEGTNLVNRKSNSKQSSLGLEGQKKGEISPASWYRRDTREELKESSGDPVEDVMLGRPRKTSTPIGWSTNSSTISGSERSLGEPLQSTGDQKMRLAESQWQIKGQGQSHVVDDMLDPELSFAARTLKIIPAASTSTVKSTKKSKNLNPEQDVMTKKQRQNAAKKEKLKAEKDESDRRQAAAFRAHQKIREAQGLAEIAQYERTLGTSKPASSSAWNESDWKTVHKSKKVSNGQNAAVDTNGKLIWE